ncbi:MAG TPA: amidohydrolase family protein, partial [Mycobacterium sp.]
MLAIRAARMFDGGRFSDGAVTVLVEDGRIVGVERGLLDVSDGWRVLDHPDGTVLPGLIDSHVHLVTDSEMGALDRVSASSDDELDVVITEGLRRQLAAGVTTVRDLGDRRFNVVVRRDRQRSGGVGEPEPTILASGPPLTSIGGHCHYMGGEVAGAEAITAAVDERVERGVDIVKVMASGGMGTLGTDVLGTQFSTEEMRLLVQRVHAAGLPVTAHAHSLSAVEQAIQVGVDGIEHCSCLTPTGPKVIDEVLAGLVDGGIFVGGALGAPPPAIAENAPPQVRAMMQQRGITPEAVRALLLEFRGRMYHAGVRFVAGADSGIAPHMAHGLLHRAVSFFVEAGASVTDALAAATSVSAQACGVDDRKGWLRKGYDADVIVVNGDLRAGVGALS